MALIIKKFFDDTSVLVIDENDIPGVGSISQLQQDIIDLNNNKVDKLQNNYEATTFPTGDDDINEGYSVGSIWYNLTYQDAFICVDATAGAAVWLNTTLTTDDLGSMAFESVDNYYDKATIDGMIGGGGGGPQKLRITIPGELIADTSNYQGLYFKNESGASWTISNVAIAVGINASGTGAACAVNLYKSSGTEADGINTNAVNLFTTAVDLGATYSSLTNTPNTTTVENGRWLSLRITSSAGVTRRASDMQVIITLT